MELDKRIAADYQKLVAFLSKSKEKMKAGFKKNKVIAGELKSNAETALHDLRTGKVFSDDEAAGNLKNTITDSLKVVGMTGIFMLPGGAVGLVALRKLLQSDQAHHLGIENLLTLTIESAEKEEQAQKAEEEKGEKGDLDETKTP